MKPDRSHITGGIYGSSRFGAIKYPAKILAFAGEAPGPSSGITYTVMVHTPEGDRRYEGAVPQSWRWPDTLDIDPALLVGKLVDVWIIGDKALLDCIEPPAFGDCPGGLVDVIAALLAAPRDQLRAMLASAGAVLA